MKLLKIFRNNKWLLLIFVVSLFFRLYKVTSYPISLTMDEVSIGYNAYSILKTGKDEWGKTLPLAFRSVGDYKPPINVYLTVLSVAVFGLSEFAVRFPVAVIGSLTAVLFSLLLKEFGFKKAGQLLGGFWLATSPWHVHYSRAGFEAVTALFFCVAGVYVFLISVRKKSYWYFSLFLALFSLSVWSYHAERLFIPLMFFALTLIYKKKIAFVFADKRRLLLSLIPFLVLTIPFAKLTFFTEAISTRALSTSIFREQSLIKILHDGKYANISEYIFNNDLYLIFRHWMGKYLNYFDLRFWFWKGMGFTPGEFFDVGLFYISDAILILPGIYLLFVSKKKKLRNLSIFWFFAGPIPASLAMNEQHPLRALVWLPFFGLAVATCADVLQAKLKKSKLLVLGWMFIFFINLFFVFDMYTRQFPRYSADAWQYGFKQMALYACENKENYSSVFITDTHGSIVPNNTGLPALYYMFYCKVDPEDFLTERKQLENINFRRVQWKSDKIVKDALIIGSYWDLLPEFVPQDRIVKTVYYPSEEPAFIFVDTRGYEKDFFWRSEQAVP